MMRRNLLALALLALCACNSGVGPPLPETQAGAKAPSRQTRVSAPQANLSSEDHDELRLLVARRAFEAYRAWAPGFAEVEGGRGVASLQPGTDYRLPVNLTAGVAYRIVSACDNECDNLDLELIDVSTGGVVADDMGRDGGRRPIVDYAPARDGAYIIRVLLQACSVSPCYVGATLTSFDTRPPSFDNVVLPAAAPRGPEGEYADEQQLRPIFEYLQERYADGFNLLLDSASRIRAGEEVRTEIRVDAGEPHAVLGACDGCSTLDLELIDPASGAVVLRETETNNHPVLYFMPPQDAAYVVRVSTPDCPDACAAGVRIRWGDVVLTRD